MKLTIDSNFRKKEHLLPSGDKLLLLDVLGKEESAYPKEEQNRNVFLVKPNNEIIWRVAYHEGSEGHDPFVSVIFDKDSRIIGGTWEGWHFEIGAADGSLKKLGWTK